MPSATVERCVPRRWGLSRLRFCTHFEARKPGGEPAETHAGPGTTGLSSCTGRQRKKAIRRPNRAAGHAVGIGNKRGQHLGLAAAGSSCRPICTTRGLRWTIRGAFTGGPGSGSPGPVERAAETPALTSIGPPAESHLEAAESVAPRANIPLGSATTTGPNLACNSGEQRRPAPAADAPPPSLSPPWVMATGARSIAFNCLTATSLSGQTPGKRVAEGQNPPLPSRICPLATPGHISSFSPPKPTGPSRVPTIGPLVLCRATNVA
jgi:hypothetical protein